MNQSVKQRREKIYGNTESDVGAIKLRLITCSPLVLACSRRSVGLARKTASEKKTRAWGEAP